MKTKSERVRVKEKRKGRCVQTAKERHMKARFKRRQGVIETGERKQTVDAIQSPFTVVQKNVNSVLFKANGIQYSCEKVSRAT